MAERNGECHLELAARPQCVALLDRASRARTAFGTVETQSERAQLDEAGAAPAARLDHGLPDGRPQSRAEDPTLVAFTRLRREHAHRSRQSAAGRGALEKSVELQAFAQRHFGAHQQRAAHRIGVLPHGRVVGRARDLRRELALVLEDRKSTRLNSSHSQISYAVFCLKKKKKQYTRPSHFCGMGTPRLYSIFTYVSDPPT